MTINVYEYGRGGKCVYMFRHTHTGIREMKMHMTVEKDFRHIRRVMRTSISTVTYVSINFVLKGSRKQKDG